MLGRRIRLDITMPKLLELRVVLSSQFDDGSVVKVDRPRRGPGLGGYNLVFDQWWEDLLELGGIVSSVVVDVDDADGGPILVLKVWSSWVPAQRPMPAG